MNPLTQDDFSAITQLIAAARQRAVQAVNTALIDLYFSSNWGAISVLSAANIRCKWAGETSRWICCFPSGQGAAASQAARILFAERAGRLSRRPNRNPPIAWYRNTG